MRLSVSPSNLAEILLPAPAQEGERLHGRRSPKQTLVEQNSVLPRGVRNNMMIYGRSKLEFVTMGLPNGKSVTANADKHGETTVGSETTRKYR